MQVRWKTFIWCRKFIAETANQISLESPEFCAKYCKKTFWSLFSGHTVHTDSRDTERKHYYAALWVEITGSVQLGIHTSTRTTTLSFRRSFGRVMRCVWTLSGIAGRQTCRALLCFRDQSPARLRILIKHGRRPTASFSSGELLLVGHHIINYLAAPWNTQQCL